MFVAHLKRPVCTRHYYIYMNYEDGDDENIDRSRILIYYKICI